MFMTRERMNGLAAIRRELAPRLKAIPVDSSSVSDLSAAVANACECWGGGCFPLIPARFDSDTWSLDEFWQEFLRDADVDWIDPRDTVYVIGTGRLDTNICSPGIGESILGVAAAQSRRSEDWAPLHVPELKTDDPWCIAYMTVLGKLAERPTAAVLSNGGLIPTVRFEDVLNIARVNVPVPGANDLQGRLLNPNGNYPIHFSTLLLSRFSPASDSIGYADTVVLPLRWAEADGYGRNIVVIYEPGSVTDGCLLWNLRAAHGLPYGLPLGVPATDGAADVIQAWVGMTPDVARSILRRRLALVTLSVSGERMAALAADLQGRGFHCDVVGAGSLLRPWKRPARLSNEIATLQNGATRIDPWAQADRDRIGPHPNLERGGGLVVNFTIQPEGLPQLPWFHAPGVPFPDGYRHGGFETVANDEDQLVDFHWPSGWTILDWAARRHGLTVTPSRAGHAALAMARRADGLEFLNLLLHPSVIFELERVSEARAMTWLKRRVREMATGIAAKSDNPDAQLQTIIDKIEEMRIGGSRQEREILTASRLRPILPKQAARDAWLSWAERVGLILRGVSVVCRDCGARFWHQLAGLTLPITCEGCGRSMNQPFQSTSLNFDYRATELLTQLVEYDALSHLFAIRWWSMLLDSGARASLLYGTHPGVEFREIGSPTLIGEADVVLMLSDGSIIPGECKRYAGGLTSRELAKLDRLAEAVAAPWTFVATLDGASKCGDGWRAAVSSPAGGRPRFALTAEHLFDRQPLWSTGTNPLAWHSMDDDAWSQRQREFSDSVGELLTFLAERDEVEQLWLRWEN